MDDNLQLHFIMKGMVGLLHVGDGRNVNENDRGVSKVSCTDDGRL